MSIDERFFINGVDGESGQYLEPPRAIADIAKDIEAKRDARLKARVEAAKGTLGPRHGVSLLDLEQAQWALVVPDDEASELRDALAPLVAHRNGRIFTYGGESRARWLGDRGVGGSDLDLSRVPYYLLVAGSSTKIPFRFVHELAVDYAVGRLELDDSREYRQYAQQLVAHEEKNGKKPPNVMLFGPRHDHPTQLSADLLLAPLAAKHKGSHFIGATATKERLAQILRDGPTILFTASHGVAFKPESPKQKEAQGALLCQDWPGVGVINEDHYFAARDIPGDVNVAGSITFHFACFGAGTPEKDRFFKRAAGPPTTLAKAPFIAALAKGLLRSGALAVVGHVDRAWGFSIASGAATQIAPFENFLDHVLAGEPVGHAMRDFADRYAWYSVELANEIERSENEEVSAESLVALWTKRNDAEAYLVIGDPAAHL